MRIKMELLPPPTDKFYYNLDELVDDVNIWAKIQGYAVRKCRIKSDPAGNRSIIKASLICSKGGTTNRRGKTLNTSSQRCNCLFQASAIHLKVNDIWELLIKNSAYSGHEPSILKGLAFHRRSAITAEVLNSIEYRIQDNNTPG